ncbi:MAG: hypothetical protein AB7G08_31505 [Hyphomicrobiaceae bacterium]
MRGVIATFDNRAGVGTIRGRDEKLYPFTRKDLLGRSQEPREAARVVFRLKNGAITRAVVVRDRDGDGWTFADFFFQILLYLPIP